MGECIPFKLLNEVNRYNENFVQKGRFGELGHPDGPTVNLDRVSHKITFFVKRVITSSESTNSFHLPWVTSLSPPWRGS